MYWTPRSHLCSVVPLAGGVALDADASWRWDLADPALSACVRDRLEGTDELPTELSTLDCSQYPGIASLKGIASFELDDLILADVALETLDDLIGAERIEIRITGAPELQDVSAVDLGSVDVIHAPNLPCSQVLLIEYQHQRQVQPCTPQPRVELGGVGRQLLVDADRGLLHVSIPWRRRIEHRRLDTLNVDSVTDFDGRPSGMDLDAAGRLLVTLEDLNQVVRLDGPGAVERERFQLSAPPPHSFTSVAPHTATNALYVAAVPGERAIVTPHGHNQGVILEVDLTDGSVTTIADDVGNVFQQRIAVGASTVSVGAWHFDHTTRPTTLVHIELGSFERGDRRVALGPPGSGLMVSGAGRVFRADDAATVAMVPASAVAVANATLGYVTWPTGLVSNFEDYSLHRYSAEDFSRVEARAHACGWQGSRHGPIEGLDLAVHENSAYVMSADLLCRIEFDVSPE